MTAYLEYPNGATGVFITTTGEAPGTNRLEIAGERGRMVVEHGKIHFTRNEAPMTEFLQERPRARSPARLCGTSTSPMAAATAEHMDIAQGFVDAILDGTEPIAPGEEGINSVELANCMLYSAWTDSTVDLPLDGAAYEAKLKEKCATSKFVKKEVREASDNINASFK